jgi:C4-dicarboxylate transporter DctM subunit
VHGSQPCYEPSRATKARPSEAIRGILPFLVILLIVLGIIIDVPALTLWFPDAIFGR